MPADQAWPEPKFKSFNEAASRCSRKYAESDAARRLASTRFNEAASDARGNRVRTCGSCTSL